MRRRTEFGFSLIEAAVAVAIMAILATAAMPLAMRALNQQREAKTRAELKTAWEAMFGAPDGSVANMGADFGFDPGVALLDLRAMTTRNGAMPNWGPNGANFSWGWNGPYWRGATQQAAGTQGLPVDGWGRVYRLDRFNAAAPFAYQIHSAGADGVWNTTDDLRYPSQATLLPRCSLTINVNIFKLVGTPAVNQPQTPLAWRVAPVNLVTIRVPNPTGAALPTVYTYNPGGVGPWPSPQTVNNLSFPPGPVQIDVDLSAASPMVNDPKTQQQVITLPPSQTKILDYNFWIP